MQLKKYGFRRVHRSYLVNINQIQKITAREITLRNNTIIPLSTERFKELHKDFVLNKVRGV